jgi:signal transduction histidine kinase
MMVTSFRSDSARRTLAAMGTDRREDARARFEELDGARRARNTRTLALGFCAICVAFAPALLVAGVDAGVSRVTLAAAIAFGVCAWLARKRSDDVAAGMLNVILWAMLFAGVAVNRQIGPAPTLVGFSLFVAAATLPLRAVVAAGAVGASLVLAMWGVARNEPQLATPPSAALTYGLSFCAVTTVLSVVQAINTRRALEKIVDREQRAIAAESRQREVEAQLQQAQKMEALGRMAAAVAHDFNNLLTVTQGAIAVTLRELPEEGKGRASLADAQTATKDAAALTRSLLAFARKSTVPSEPIDTREALRALSGLLPRALGPDVELDVDIDAELPPVIAAPAQLEQVVLNLAVNARDAMPDGGKLAVRARKRRLTDDEERGCVAGDWLELVVRDSGTGMTEDVMAHLFEPFFTTKPAGKGTGLGLSTCYGIVRQLGGTIRAKSAPGKGTTFTVLLPRAATR